MNQQLTVMFWKPELNISALPTGLTVAVSIREPHVAGELRDSKRQRLHAPVRPAHLD